MNEVLGADALKVLHGWTSDAVRKPEIVDVDGLKFLKVNDTLKDVRDFIGADPQPDTLKFWSLQALVDFVHSGLDAALVGESAIHVRNPFGVDLIGPVLRNHHRQRLTIAQATRRDPDQPVGEFNRWLSQADAMLWLLTRFHETADLAKVVEIIGNVTSESAVTEVDDGTAQQVTVRAGTSRLANARTQPYYMLQPIRTFLEIEQPISRVILRLRQAESHGNAATQVGLFIGDGGLWQVTAVTRIVAWLRSAVNPEKYPVERIFG